jgi:hypothetical protein
MTARGLIAMTMIGAIVCSACSHKDRYDQAHGIFADDIGTVATYAPLLDAANVPPSSARDAIVGILSDAAADQICLRSRLAFPPPSAAADDPSGRISAIFGALGNACCDHIDKKNSSADAATQLATQCKASVDRARTDLASIDAEAVKIGLPAHTVPGIDDDTAQHADDLDRNEVAAILLEATPTVAETHLAEAWLDPNTRAIVLSASCEAAANSERIRVPTDPKGISYVPAVAAQQARADVTAKKCALVKSYQALARELSDAAVAKKKSGVAPPDTTGFCQRWKDLYDPTQAPAAVSSLLPDVQARCKS